MENTKVATIQVDARLLRTLSYRIILDAAERTAQWGDLVLVKGRVEFLGMDLNALVGGKCGVRIGGRVFDPPSDTHLKECRGDFVEVNLVPDQPIPFEIYVNSDFLEPKTYSLELNLVIDSVGWFQGSPLRTDFTFKSDSRFVDVDKLIGELTVEGLCQTAEDYFASTPDEPWHKTKPYSVSYAMHGFPQFGFMLRGLAPIRGSKIVDFGSGTGWAARALNQLGMEVYAVDVSTAALHISEQLSLDMPRYQPLPPMHFVRFDGHSLAKDIPDASIDCIFCLDALHHVPNLEDILREMARILKPGGRAGFCEAGERHALNPHAQQVMKKYRVLENNINMYEVEEIGKKYGLRDLVVMLQNAMPHSIPLAHYANFKAGTSVGAKYIAEAKERMKHCQIFFMSKSAK